MSDYSIIASGVMGMLVACVHQWLGTTMAFPALDILPDLQKRLFKAIFVLSTIYWFVGGLVLVFAPFYMSPETRFVTAIVVALLFISGAVGNFWITRGRHFGWILLVIAALLALSGA